MARTDGLCHLSAAFNPLVVEKTGCQRSFRCWRSSSLRWSGAAAAAGEANADPPEAGHVRRIDVTGSSSVRQSTGFGSQGPRVQIPPPRLGPRVVVRGTRWLNVAALDAATAHASPIHRCVVAHRSVVLYPQRRCRPRVVFRPDVQNVSVGAFAVRHRSGSVHVHSGLE